MTFVRESCDINNYHIAIEQEKYSSCYKVTECLMIDGLGYNQQVWLCATEKQARRKYNALRRQLERY